jgi:hypothetical protein
MNNTLIYYEDITFIRFISWCKWYPIHGRLTISGPRTARYKDNGPGIEYTVFIARPIKI